jgi:lipopolysaccharide biosynthesis regulator YciM
MDIVQSFSTAELNKLFPKYFETNLIKIYFCTKCKHESNLPFATCPQCKSAETDTLLRG